MKPEEKSASDVEEAKSQPSLAKSIGERVRAYRARRGIARKNLSAQSGISERYLAQIETGKANISIELLQRLAQAMVVPLHGLLPALGQQALPNSLSDLLHRLSSSQLEEAYQLLARHFAPPRTCQSGIALIGIRFGGKTTLGELLASELSLPFIRLSQVIEAQGGMKVGEVLELGGQRTYRRLERQALEHVNEQHPLSVLEVGGGLVTEPETFQKLLSSFYTVWLKASPDELMRRLMAEGDMRPLEGNNLKIAKEDLTRILTERDADYRQADHILETTGRTVEECFLELVSVSRPVMAPFPAMTTEVNRTVS
ncbi:helix-turn-helix transcriptional regulator [Halomonas korlensis]|uniref:Shikimate kinase n=1 Tax=Halomonas korlensis TaxID=463301 RepID=A0A1I7J936_9GAMM|nr:helix-turn-helix transcriptional regulator [Halomonas korlensis]SFU81716.1 transcriptional regulator, XRE family with shikimate kinase activity [Halomonas korlensis]